MKKHKYFFLTISALVLVFVAGSFDLFGSASDVPPASNLLVAGFFGSIWGGIKKVGGVALKVAPIIPGVGTVVGGVAGAIGALSKGGQVQTITPPAVVGQPATVQTIGTPVAQIAGTQQAGFSFGGQDLANMKIGGIPILWIGFGALGVMMIMKSRRA